MHGTVLDFETHRRRLLAIAYRMLGSRADAEDVVQDAWMRWNDVRCEEVENVPAFLSRIVTRFCLDRMKSAQSQREVYVGTWLPEPVVDDDYLFQPELLAAHELACDLSFAFLLMLERLSPLERAAFLLHDVFDMSFSDIASMLDKKETACRQLAARARVALRSSRRSIPLLQESGARLAQAFVSAARDGDVAALASVLAEDVVFLSDGGGHVAAVPYALLGQANVLRAITGFATKLVPDAIHIRPARINGLAGLVVSTNGEMIQTMAFEMNAEGLINAIYIMRNPEKLRRVTP